jgi:hypothetical protein
MADNKSVMEFIETPVFTKLITELLPDDSYRLLQDDLAKNPQAGDLIPGAVEFGNFDLLCQARESGVVQGSYTTGRHRRIKYTCCWLTPR